MKRFDVVSNDPYDMEEALAGMWVLWDDVEQAARKLAAEVHDNEPQSGLRPLVLEAFGLVPQYLEKGCGACLAWGALPKMQDGKCQTCGRTEAQIATGI